MAPLNMLSKIVSVAAVILLPGLNAFTVAGRTNAAVTRSVFTVAGAGFMPRILGKASNAPQRSFSSQECSMSAADFIESEINSKDIVVFSKTFCPFCSSTKQLFSGMNVDFTVIELDQRGDGGEIQKALLDKTGQRTVPNVFVKGTHVGGNDDTQAAARSGKLNELLGL
ncbi:unnamed protein product [Heterosigma akashiwo]|eukprot:CAMPEP_0194575758 /NCGR_PEP_ID=MMETSP0292-20121207/11120_1 /TAXON_ID=39354 /ORGANISM="Heterosigma akashiwo, Strain CCMP2393" /LENGTH=168 /DNA_ID=CAMNT_0039427621 /DNA_START=59 /DNA_END=565 /DNA_ORIENTATION=+